MNVFQTHYFLAFDLDSTSKDWAQKQQEKLAKEIGYSAYKSWVHKEDFHITIQFFGALSQDQLDRIKELMNKLADFNKIETYLSSGGYFGTLPHPRVVVLDVQLTEYMNELIQFVKCYASTTDLPVDKRSYSPHVTLAKKVNEKYMLDQHVAFFDQAPAQKISSKLKSISLYSVQHTTPNYHIVRSIELK
ncbi:2'-5' RNA ligase [Pelagirhabdus alkalitolerans]|uniref:RNA 2',3'-cyclic phosphodiesterase n=1 Tax=Pelagirhabdus alkalitolerans TaxID=1612202 RepID=A0A1G6HI04_9BACI|nr:RNA 2',3'-cyclic phosphodiesterase [Pelagirhabdus alkalitolerans]SDB93862.1 2'-5' RNA ligase [Pelagirhabdus alkalitolerans]